MLKILGLSLLSLSQALSARAITKQSLPLHTTRLRIPQVLINQVPSLHNTLVEISDRDVEQIDLLYHDVVCSIDYLPCSDLETIRS